MNKKCDLRVIIVIALCVFTYCIGMILGKTISTHGVEAWGGFIIPISMLILFLPISAIEIILCRLLDDRFRLLKFIFYFQLILFPIGIGGLFIYFIFK